MRSSSVGRERATAIEKEAKEYKKQKIDPTPGKTDWRKHEKVTTKTLEELKGETRQGESMQVKAPKDRINQPDHVIQTDKAKIVADSKYYLKGEIDKGEVDKLKLDKRNYGAGHAVMVVNPSAQITGTAKESAEKGNVSIVRTGQDYNEALKKTIEAHAFREKPQVQFTGSGDIDKRSTAVKSGDVSLDSEGKVNPESKMVKEGKLRLTQEGKPDKENSEAYSEWKESRETIDTYTQRADDIKEYRSHHRKKDGIELDRRYKENRAEGQNKDESKDKRFNDQPQYKEPKAEETKAKDSQREPSKPEESSSRHKETGKAEEDQKEVKQLEGVDKKIEEEKEQPSKQPSEAPRSDITPNMPAPQQEAPQNTDKPAHTTKSGEPDMRYSENKEAAKNATENSAAQPTPSTDQPAHTTKSGEPDMRYSENKEASKNMSEGVASSNTSSSSDQPGQNPSDSGSGGSSEIKESTGAASGDSSSNQPPSSESSEKTGNSSGEPHSEGADVSHSA